MVKINKIKETECLLYHIDEFKPIGKISSLLELNDIRIQIKKGKLYGYYVIWDDRIINIDEYANMEWPIGFFDIYDIQLDELLGWNY